MLSSAVAPLLASHGVWNNTNYFFHTLSHYTCIRCNTCSLVQSSKKLFPSFRIIVVFTDRLISIRFYVEQFHNFITNGNAIDFEVRRIYTDKIEVSRDAILEWQIATACLSFLISIQINFDSNI